jgi:hypothetical protein
MILTGLDLRLNNELREFAVRILTVFAANLDAGTAYGLSLVALSPYQSMSVICQQRKGLRTLTLRMRHTSHLPGTTI